MTPPHFASKRRAFAQDNAARVAVVAVLSATAMLFASLSSAYILRRSFEDWRPSSDGVPLVLLALGVMVSTSMEMAFRTDRSARRAAFMFMAVACAWYLAAVFSLIAQRFAGEVRLSEPHSAFVVLLLGVHAAHAVLGALFSFWALGGSSLSASAERWFLARLVVHFLTGLLLAILGVLFVLR